MGLGNKLIVSASGFPGTNKTLRFIQDAFKEPLGALAQMAGEKTIITGVVPDGKSVSNGFITYKGEIIPFQGGTIASTVTIIEEFENANYNIDANDDTILDSLPAYRTIYAICGTGGIDIFNFSELTPLKTVKELSSFKLPANIVIDANYVHTENNLTKALFDKLNQLNYTENNLTKALLDKLNQLNYTENNFTTALLNKLNQLNYTENNFTVALLNKLNQLNYTENNLTAALLNKLNQLNYTENDFTAVLLDKLNNIEYGAQKNISANWGNLADKPFQSIVVTSGSMTTDAVSLAYVYPPSGFKTQHLSGFIPSINRIAFSGVVNDDDTLTCSYSVRLYNDNYSQGSVEITCSNSEQDGPALVNYLAIWIK